MRVRIGITGLGVISSAGGNRRALADAVAQGRSALKPIDDPRVTHLRARFAGQVDSIAHPHIAADRHIRLALVAAREALHESGVCVPVASTRMGLVHATCSGPMLTIERQYAAALHAAPSLNENDLAARAYDSGAVALARSLGISGAVVTVTTACSASVCAVGTACDLIRNGSIDWALVGGADAFSLTTLAGFDALRATCEQRCAPFSRPVGMCLGEAGAYAVIERLDNARARGAAVLAEVLGFGSSNDAYHCSSPDPSGRGSAAAMKRSLIDAGLQPGDISYVNAHGTGTESNDKAETRALRVAFGERIATIPVSSVKGVTGHCLGAAGMLEIAASIGCAEQGVLPPTANHDEAREGCGLDYVARSGRRWEAGHPFMSCNLAFGGNNAAVVLQRERDDPDDGPDARHREVFIRSCAAVTPALLSSSGMQAGMALSSISPRVIPAASFDIRAIDRRLDVRGLDRASALACGVSALALDDAGLGGRRAARAEVGLYMHCFHAPVWAESEHVVAVLANDYHIDRLSSFPYVVPNSVCGNVARSLSLVGHNATFCLGEGGALAGLALAAAAVQGGRSDALLSVSADEIPGGVLGDSLSAALGRSEGAAAFLLQSAAAVEPPDGCVARVCGAAMSFGAAQGDRIALVRDTVVRALQRAGIEPGDIDMVCCDSRQADAVGALRSLAPLLGDKVVDFGREFGYPLSCGTVLTLAMLLLANRFVADSANKYILSLLASPVGYNAAIVLSTGMADGDVERRAHE